MARTKAPRPREAYHHGDLRAALLETARELVREQGVAGFSLREAARRIGVDPAACYRHFRGREEVIEALASEGFAALAAESAREGARASADPRAGLLALARAYLGFALAHRAEFRVMFGESGTHARDPRLRPPGVERTAYEQLEEAVQAFLRAAGIRRQASRVALVLWAGVHGATRLVIDGAVPLDEAAARRLVEETANLLLDALEGEAARRR